MVDLVDFAADSDFSTPILKKDGYSYTVAGLSSYFSALKKDEKIVEVSGSIYEDDRSKRTIFLNVSLGSVAFRAEVTYECDKEGKRSGSASVEPFSDSSDIHDEEAFYELVGDEIDFFGSIDRFTDRADEIDFIRRRQKKESAFFALNKSWSLKEFEDYLDECREKGLVRISKMSGGKYNALLYCDVRIGDLSVSVVLKEVTARGYGKMIFFTGSDGCYVFINDRASQKSASIFGILEDKLELTYVLKNK